MRPFDAFIDSVKQVRQCSTSSAYLINSKRGVSGLEFSVLSSALANTNSHSTSLFILFFVTFSWADNDLLQLKRPAIFNIFTFRARPCRSFTDSTRLLISVVWHACSCSEMIPFRALLGMGSLLRTFCLVHSYTTLGYSARSSSVGHRYIVVGTYLSVEWEHKIILCLSDYMVSFVSLQKASYNLDVWFEHNFFDTTFQRSCLQRTVSCKSCIWCFPH